MVQGETMRLITAAAMGHEGTSPLPGFHQPPTPSESLVLKTADGECPAHLFKPEGSGPWPGVVFLMDGFGMRPTIMAMAQRLADCGYLVLLPDLFYRHGPYDPLDVPQIFASGNLLEGVRSKIGPSPSIAMALADAPAFLSFLQSHRDAAEGGIGLTGYCMSGGMALAIAGTHPDAVAAAACFHGGLLVSDTPDSPHGIAERAKGELYVGGAQTDQWCPPEMVEQLDLALSRAGIEHRCDIYQGTHHGWTMRDSPVYNEAAAEWHWLELIGLLRRALGPRRADGVPT